MLDLQSQPLTMYEYATTSFCGIAYFSLFVLQFFILHLSSSPSINILTVIFFSFGIVLWCFSGLLYRFLRAFQGDSAVEWQTVELGFFFSSLFGQPPFLLLSSCFHPKVQFRSGTSPRLQPSQLATSSILCSVNLARTPCATDFPTIVSLVLLSLVSTIYALTEKTNTLPLLAFEYCRIVFLNLLGAALYSLQPLERLGIAPGWRPSLYVMHLVLAYTFSNFFKVISDTALIA
ncbi:uncharacterized protein ASPGLDRAFT_1455067 [Aspergillus glaucus CBS 516.65]|uniref:Uncharacterized protein n=1 Tax=Aspergillus glaucus CBS 516.65 TaxID=1160497 RepID=A0A1L9VKW2_ASPGL|nr:hypothetical protein ASPGLDRAFT_1455067 [Aspergillus glaucus CBS 516.65]OJJ84569.1 hypothetical protein ASPGLDRAFT_1455067 [Aspergillus glaucus CBS 516.65]